MEYKTIDYIEVIEAADEALYHLEKARDALSSAQGLGIWDMLGGGIFASMLKRGKMGDARVYLDNAKRAIEDFKDELDDIDMEFDIDMGGFMDVADVWFDNAFVDFMVQSNINDTKRNVENAIHAIKRIREDIDQMINR